MPRALTIGQVAKLTGVTAKSIRYYEAIGIVPAARRGISGYRHYDEAGVHRLRFIRRARALGLPLARLKALTATLDGSPSPRLRPRLRALVREQLATVQHRIAELESLQRELRLVSRRMLAGLGSRGTGPCRCLEADTGAKP